MGSGGVWQPRRMRLGDLGEWSRGDRLTRGAGERGGVCRSGCGGARGGRCTRHGGGATLERGLGVRVERAEVGGGVRHGCRC
jgi:hypothetical protein